LAVSGSDQRDAALGDRTRCQRLGFGTDFIDDDDLRHVVFNRFDHHRMLVSGIRDLHPSSEPNARMWNVAIAGNFV
jgi:hypothetical protein